MMKTKLNNFKPTAVALAISGALLMSSQAYSAETEDEAKDSGNVVIVTANRREESILKVPYNISAVAGETIDEAQITDAAELMRNIAGVAVVDRGQRNAGVINGIMIRGLNVDGSALGDYALSTVPTVSTYVNDTPVYANIYLKDIQRVEVLRGPQGTLYGSGSMGGTVKYILNRPELGEFSGKISAGLSSTEGSDSQSWNTDLILNMPLSDSMALRLVTGTANYAGITDYVNVYELDANRVPVAPSGVFSTDAVLKNVKDADSVDLSYARIMLLLEPSDTFSALFTYQTQSDDVGGRRQQTKGLNGFGEAYNSYENGSVMLEPSSSAVDLASLEMDFDLGFATLTSSSSSYDHSGDSISENTGFYAQNGWLGAFYYNYPRPMAEAQRTYSDKAFVQELRLVSNGDETMDYIVGLFYKNQDLVATQNSYLRGFTRWADAAFGPGVVVSDNDFAYVRNENLKEFSIFGELSYELSDDMTMTIGARRYDHTADTNTSMSVGLYSSFNIQDTANPTPVNDSGYLFKANLAYDLADNKMIYATISEGYRRGGNNAVPTVGIFAEDPNWLTFNPDTNTNYEMGIKGGDGDMQYNVSVFYVDWQDIQINTATSNWGFFAVQNGGPATTSGLEVELQGYLGADKAWHYGVGYAHVNAKLSGDVFTPPDVLQTNPVAFDGTQLPGTPSDSFNFSLTHTQTMENGWYWSNRFAGYYQSDTENAISSSPRFAQNLPSFSILDFSSSISADNWSATLWIKNLTNEEGSTGVFKEEYMGTSPAQNYNGNGSKSFLALPRTLGVTLSYEF